MARQESFTLKGKVEFDSKDAEQNVQGLNKGINKTNKSTSKLSQGASKLKGKLDAVTGGAVTGFSKMAKSIGGANKGFRAMKIAIAATGVGALVIAVVALVQAFKRSEEGQDKLNRIMTIAGAVVDNLLDVFADLGEVIIDAVTNPKKAWDKLTKALGDGWKFIKKAVITPLVAGFENFALNFKKNIKKARIAWNEFTGDSEEAEKLKGELDEINEKIKENEKKIKEGAEEVIKFYAKASGAVEEFINNQKEEVKQADEVAKKRNKADKLERKLLVQRAKSQRKIAELRLKAEKEGEFTAEQRKQFLIEANNLQKDLTEKEVEAAKLREEAQRIENSLNKSSKEDKKKLAELTAARIGKENESFRLQRQLATRLKTINNQIESEEEKKQKKKAKRQKAIAEIEQSLAEETANKEISEEQKKLNKWRETQLKKLEALKGFEKEQNRLKEQIEAEFKERQKEIEKKEKQKEAEKRIEELEAKRAKDFENAEAEFKFLKAQKERIKNMEVLTEKQKAEQLMKVNSQLAKAKNEKSKLSSGS